MPDRSLIEQAQAEAERLAQNTAGLTLAYDRDRVQAEAHVQRTWGQWAASVWAKWTRQPGPDDASAGVKVERKW